MKKRWKLKEVLLSSTLALSLGMCLPHVVAEEGEEPVDLEEFELLELEETQSQEEDLQSADHLEITEQEEEVTADETVVRESETAITLEQYKEADATEMARWIREGHASPEQLMEYAYEVIEETDPELHNIISLRKELALEELEAMEYEDQPFYGVPILVKGLGHTVKGGIDSLGLTFMKDNVSEETGDYVKSLQDAGFVVLGQTSYPQFGWINVTKSDLYGSTHNPWNLDHNPGGSSGGSSAAVAIGQVPIASTSDAGGSTRIPASWSGVIGLHPSRGILKHNSDSKKSQTTYFANTKTMEDTKALFEYLIKDEKKADVQHIPLSKDMRIAYTTKTPAGTPISQDAIQAIQEAVTFLESQGFKTEEVDYPIDGKHMMMNYYTIASAAAQDINGLAQEFLGRDLKAEDVELLTWAFYQTGQVLDEADIDKAWEEIGRMTEQFNAFHQAYDFFLTPTAAFTAPAADFEFTPEALIPSLLDMSGLSKEERLNLVFEQCLPTWSLSPYTPLANLTGTPAISLPTYVSPEGLPLGILLSSTYGKDRLLLQMGDLFEQNHRFHLYYSSKEEVEDEVEAFDTLVRFNKDLEYGKKRQLQQGENRISKKTYLIKYEGTKEVSRTLVSEETLSKGRDAIIEVGTKVIPVVTKDETSSQSKDSNDPLGKKDNGPKEHVRLTKEDTHPKENLQRHPFETKQGNMLPETGETYKPHFSLFALLSLLGAASLKRKKHHQA